MKTVTFKEVGANILNTLQRKNLTQQMLADRLEIRYVRLIEESAN